MSTVVILFVRITLFSTNLGKCIIAFTSDVLTNYLSANISFVVDAYIGYFIRSSCIMSPFDAADHIVLSLDDDAMSCSAGKPTVDRPKPYPYLFVC